jgi:hypothetical protein
VSSQAGGNPKASQRPGRAKAKRGEENKRKMGDFFNLLAICHSVIPEKNEATGEVSGGGDGDDDDDDGDDGDDDDDDDDDVELEPDDWAVEVLGVEPGR